jgi:hypothetical protein
MSEIFTNLLAEYTWKKTVILQDFMDHQEAVNPYPSQEDPYLLPSYTSYGGKYCIISLTTLYTVLNVVT